MFGQPIIAQAEGGIYVDTNRLEDWGDVHEEPRNSIDAMKKIPIMDMDGHERPNSEEWSEMDDPISYGIRAVGWHFDGLGRGMHLEIKYDEATTEFSVHYKGYLVYKEVKGELAAYIPISEWEGWIDQLYKGAKEVQRRRKEEEFSAKVIDAERSKAGWLREMASRWGMT
jgi:hypothetical protein